MNSSRRLICLTVLLVSILMACNLPATQSESNVDGGTQTLSDESTAAASPDISITDQPPAGETATTSLLEGTLQITKANTPPSQTVTITSTEDTNCRKGPGVMYEIVGKLLMGQTSIVIAKYQNGKFWLIQNPANPSQECWVWDQTTSVSGDIASLPEATPPATPQVTLNLTIYALISPITYNGSCPVMVELTGNYTINTPAIISYQWFVGDLQVASGAVTAGSGGTYTSTDQITITSITMNPIRLSASAPPKSITTSPISFSINCN